MHSSFVRKDWTNFSIVGRRMKSNTTVDPTTNYDSAFSLMLTDAFKIPSACTLILISVVGTASNLLTIVSFLTDRKLRKRVYDFFIFNLAICDLLICSVSIPPYIVNLLHNEWSFGKVVCKFWLVEDYTVCGVASFTIMILSADRLLMLVLGPRYNIVVTMRRAMILAVFSWMCAFLMYGPAVIWWEVWSGESVVGDNECYPEFIHNSTFTTTLTLLDTTIPLTSLIVTNGLMYYKLWVRNKPETLKFLGRCVSTHSSSHQSSHCPSPTSSDIARGMASSKSTGMPPSPTGTHPRSPRLAKQQISFAKNTKNDVPNTSNNINTTRDSLTIPQEHFRKSVNSTSGGSTKTDKFRQSCRLSYTMQTRINVKAAKFLSSLVLVYIVCWGPFSVTSIMVSFYGEDSINPVVYQLIFWWLWVKSVVNPFLYSYNCKRYRMNIKRILLCQRCR